MEINKEDSTMKSFVIYFNPQDTRNYTRWMNYAAKCSAISSYRDGRWYTNDTVMSGFARKVGMLVATVTVEAIS